MAMDQVLEFYSAWETFSTRQRFSRVDKWDVTEGYNRFERRYIDKENERIRKKARREYTETVHELLHFVRRRDPRYKEAVAARREEQELKEQQRLQKEREQRLKEAQELKGISSSSSSLQDTLVLPPMCGVP